MAPWERGLLVFVLAALPGCWASTPRLDSGVTPDEPEPDADVGEPVEPDADVPGDAEPDGQPGECDRPGQVCISGGERWCDDPVSSLPGRQVCAPDGMGWGRCVETPGLPQPCASVDPWFSPAVAACLIELGECVQDFWDLDGDGDRDESLGDCEGIACEQDGTCRSCGSGCRGCAPGERRYCLEVDYGDGIGEQHCRHDGSWSPCTLTERRPDVCAIVGSRYSPDWQRCCIEVGACCQDAWDLDEDGDIWESLGRCGPGC